MIQEQEFVHISEATGAKIRQQRVSLNITQSQLADIVGASVQQIGHCEAGNYDVAVDRVFALAQALSLSPAQLLADD
ncbi:MAG: XRE family transcriptional regulator [Clostridia bacterium]|nr:XRE family transcriptional regulator [Clostridia bacterium]